MPIAALDWAPNVMARSRNGGTGMLSADECRMNKIAADSAQPCRSLIAGYAGVIRLSDSRPISRSFSVPS
jgi:hypothetical protein